MDDWPNLHKSPRIAVMIDELQHAGADIHPVVSGGMLDGFSIDGRDSYPGGATLSCHGDYRVFNALVLVRRRLSRAL